MYSDQELKLCIAIDRIIQVKNALGDKHSQLLVRAIGLINSAIDDDESYMHKEDLEQFIDEFSGVEEDE